MAKNYDVIVIGAGMGGLSAGTFLASKGKRVLILERHNIPGGYSTSFVRGRFEFEVALHELSGIGPEDRRSALYRYLESIGVAQKVEFVPVGEMYRSVFPEIDITLPIGREAYEQTLIDAFPHEKEGIAKFLRRIDVMFKELAPILKTQRPGNPLKMGNVMRYFPLTWGEVLNRDVKDPVARGVISQYWGYFGMGPSECSFMYFAIALREYMVNGPWFMRGRSQQLANAFVAALEEHGGEIRFNEGVKKIETANGRVTGVVTEHDDVVSAPYIMSNANPVSTVNDLIGRDKVPAGFYNKLRFRKPAASSFNVYLGLAKPPEQLGLTDHEVFINDDLDLDGHARMMYSIGKPPAIAMTTYNAVLPEISPPGTSMTVMTTLMYGEPWLRVPPEKYLDTKRMVADHMLRKLEKFVPGVRDEIEEMEIATPITNMRYADTMAGSIYGSQQPPADATILRLPYKGPIDGLFFCGAWTPPGGGFEPAMMSGQMSSMFLLRDMKKRNAKIQGGVA